MPSKILADNESYGVEQILEEGCRQNSIPQEAIESLEVENRTASSCIIRAKVAWGDLTIFYEEGELVASSLVDYRSKLAAEFLHKKQEVARWRNEYNAHHGQSKHTMELDGNTVEIPVLKKGQSPWG
jgi:hypothetical protein